jgi:hypothetical protein
MQPRDVDPQAQSATMPPGFTLVHPAGGCGWLRSGRDVQRCDGVVPGYRHTHQHGHVGADMWDRDEGRATHPR